MDEALYRTAAHLVHAAQRILLISHVHPDGDAVGSLLGLGLALCNAGKQVQMVLADGIPASLRHLEGSDQIAFRPKGDFDLTCVLDCSDTERIGDFYTHEMVIDINIDHHRTNLNFATHNFVDSQAVATAELVFEFLQVLGYPLTQPVAAALLTGLITDTIGFRTGNMTPKALRMSASLMEAGGNLPELYHRALITRSFEAARFWGAGLIKLEREGRLVWTTLTQADRQMASYPGRDDADLINMLSSIEPADIAVIFVEQANGHVKVSWRAKSGIDVSQLALEYGGGGHAAASGADVMGSLPEVCAQVLAATRVLLNGRYSADR